MVFFLQVRRGEQAEGRLATVMRGREECERSLGAALKSRQHAEGKLSAALKVQMELKERVLLAERGMEDEKNLLNVVHAENLRLEHDLAFLKAVLEDTQKVWWLLCPLPDCWTPIISILTM